MSSSLKSLSTIDARTKYAVYGWIRKSEIELEICHIPMMLRCICSLYYRDDEVFHTIGNDVKLSKNKKYITKIGRDNSCNFNYGIYCK